jgi:Neocarzinostatin family
MLGRTVLALVALLTLGGALPPSPATAGDPAPRIGVSPSTHLAEGEVVSVRLRHLPAGATVDLFECDVFDIGTEPPCGAPVAITTASRVGSAKAAVTLQDPVYRSEEFGDPTVVYCRSDVCRIIATWTDANGQQHAVATAPLDFTGAPATIAVSDADDLVDGQQILVTGTALGAAGRRVAYTEEACFSLVQGSGCYGQIGLGEGVVERDGTFHQLVTVHRFLGDGTDCADQVDLLGTCEISAAVLRADGQPDDTYGVASRGQPAAFLSFAAP